jgi:dephospho-CoA kinase
MGLKVEPGYRLRIGLTGGIGSGKSTVAAAWLALGATLIDTDAIARQLTAADGAALPAIKARFGPKVIDSEGALDRAYMRELAFGDARSRVALEAIVHPMIRKEVARLSANAHSRLIVFDVPLLVESGRWRTEVDKVLVVDCLESSQIERVVCRSSWTREAVMSVIEQQATRSARRTCADAVIYNEQLSLAQVAEQVRALHDYWLG